MHFFLILLFASLLIRLGMINYCEVPSVTGLTQNEAVHILSNTELNAFCPIPVDENAKVLSQNPSEGEIVKKGITVELEFEIAYNEPEPVDHSLVQTGKTITFGTYEQDNNHSNGTESIEWLVLDVQDDKALLLSLHALDSQPYNNIYGPTTWEECALHSWLKDTFLETAFTVEEKAATLITEIDNSVLQNNSEWHVKGCKNTDDMVFLLSYADTDRYFDNHEERICTPTDYAITQGADVRTLDDGKTNACWWWLRSPGENSTQASFVNFDGTRYTNGVGNDYLSVRPALWIDIEKYTSLNYILHK